MSKQMMGNVRFQMAAAVACAALLPAVTFGQARTWDGGTDADNKWSTANNWSTDTAPPTTPAPGEGWRFGSSATELNTDMDLPYSFGQLQFGNVSGYVVNSSTGSTMSLSGFNNGTFIQIVAPNIASNVATVNVPITLNSLNPNDTNATTLLEVNRRTINTDAGTVVLNGTLTANADPSRNFDVRKIGSGTLVLNAANNMSGSFQVNNGTVRLGDDLALGAATFSNPTANSIRLLPEGGNRTLANPFNLSGLGGIGFTEDNGFNTTLNGPIDLGATGATALGAGLNTTVTVNGVISGAAGFGKGAQGTMVLNNSNTYTGTTTIANGRLIVNGTNTSDTLAGAGTLAGTGSVRILSVFGTGVLSPGSDTTADTIDASRADFADGGSYLFNLNDVATGAGIGWDLLNLNGAGTPNANLDVTAGAGGFTINLTGAGAGFDDATDQIFTMVDADAVTGFDPSDFVIDTSGFAPAYTGTFSVTDTGGDLNLVYTAIPEPAGIALVGLAGLAMLTRRRRAVIKRPRESGRSNANVMNLSERSCWTA